MASSPLQTISLLALLILISAVTSTSKNKRGALLGALVALSSLFYLYFFSEYLEHTKGILVNVAGFGFGIIACYTIVFIRRQVLVEGESALIHKAFTHYVGDQVLNELLEKQDLLAPQGTKKELTILFADIRGFTSISESTDPEIVVSQLREFFEIMGSVVLNCGGYINKFLGDGFLVLFGLSGAKDHAAQALNSAHLMLEALEKKNKKWKEEGKPFLNIGVGIHTGIVLWGNIGLKTRLEFTVIGDAVNVAARIQELTKDYSPIPILFSESTLEKISGEKKILLSKDFTFQELGEINVRGRKSAIKLYGTT